MTTVPPPTSLSIPVPARNLANLPPLRARPVPLADYFLLSPVLTRAPFVARRALCPRLSPRPPPLRKAVRRKHEHSRHPAVGKSIAAVWNVPLRRTLPRLPTSLATSRPDRMKTRYKGRVKTAIRSACSLCSSISTIVEISLPASLPMLCMTNSTWDAAVVQLPPHEH